MSKTFLKISFLGLVLVAGAPSAVRADGPPGFGGDVSDVGGGGGGAGVPLDSGVSLLLAAGIGYGAKKYADSRKAAKVNN